MRAHIDDPGLPSVTCQGSRWKRGSEEKAIWLTLVVSNLFDSGTSKPPSQEAKQCNRSKKQATICCFTEPIRDSLASALRKVQSCLAVLHMLSCLFCFLRQVFNDRSMSEESFHVMEQLTSTRNTRTETASFTWTKMVNLSNENKRRSRFTPFDKSYVEQEQGMHQNLIILCKGRLLRDIKHHPPRTLLLPFQIIDCFLALESKALLALHVCCCLQLPIFLAPAVQIGEARKVITSVMLRL